jgi:hypothetical protein
LRHIDHSPEKFRDLARFAQDGMADIVDVPDGSVRENNAIVKFEVDLILLSALIAFSDVWPIFRVNPVEMEFRGGRILARSDVHHSFNLGRHLHCPRVQIVCPTTGVA